MPGAAAAGAAGFHGAGRRRAGRRRRISCSRASGARSWPARCAAAGAAAVGVHAEPLRGLHVAGGQRADGTERVDGARAPVPRDSQTARAAGRRRDARAGRTSSWRKTPCQFLTALGAPVIWTTPRSASLWSRCRATARSRSRRRLHLDCVRGLPRPLSTRWLTGIGDDAAVAEADEAFPAERLAAQQAQILRRLEALERPARVIAFPKHAAPVISGHSQRPPLGRRRGRRRPDRRLGAGQLLDLRRTPRLRPQLPERRRSRRRHAAPCSPPRCNSDDALLYDDADLTPRVEALQALDAITPRRRAAVGRIRRITAGARRARRLTPYAASAGSGRSRSSSARAST